MKENRRIKITKQLIKEAFIDLIEKIPINKITVKQICTTADVNRSTFYAHYSDQYDLFDEIQDDIVNITPQVSIYKTKSIYQVLKDFFILINNNKRIYRILFENTTGMHFRNRILNKVFNKRDNNIDWIYGEMNLSHRIDFKVLMCAFGGMTMIERWIFGEIEESPEDLAKYMSEYIEKA